MLLYRLYTFSHFILSTPVWVKNSHYSILKTRTLVSLGRWNSQEQRWDAGPDSLTMGPALFLLPGLPVLAGSSPHPDHAVLISGVLTVWRSPCPNGYLINVC